MTTKLFFVQLTLRQLPYSEIFSIESNILSYDLRRVGYRNYVVDVNFHSVCVHVRNDEGSPPHEYASGASERKSCLAGRINFQ